LPYTQPRHRIADLDDFGNGLVTERERPAQGDEARRQEEIDVAASHDERTNEGLCVAFEARLGYVAPLDLVRRRASELSHRRIPWLQWERYAERNDGVEAHHREAQPEYQR